MIILGFSSCWTAAILDFHMKVAHNFKNNPTDRFHTPKTYKKEVLHKILGQPDQKLAVYNGLHPALTRFPILGV